MAHCALFGQETAEPPPQRMPPLRSEAVQKAPYPTQILEPGDTVEPLIDHIQITVKDMSLAVPFYEKLLPLLGFDASKKAAAVIEEHEFHVVDDSIKYEIVFYPEKAA